MPSEYVLCSCFASVQVAYLCSAGWLSVWWLGFVECAYFTPSLQLLAAVQRQLVHPAAAI
jgi:hypothetical protein